MASCMKRLSYYFGLIYVVIDLTSCYLFFTLVVVLFPYIATNLWLKQRVKCLKSVLFRETEVTGHWCSAY